MNKHDIDCVQCNPTYMKAPKSFDKGDRRFIKKVHGSPTCVTTSESTNYVLRSRTPMRLPQPKLP